jgi:hypothetical protein
MAEGEGERDNGHQQRALALSLNQNRVSFFNLSLHFLVAQTIIICVCVCANASERWLNTSAQRGVQTHNYYVMIEGLFLSLSQYIYVQYYVVYMVHKAALCWHRRSRIHHWCCSLHQHIISMMAVMKWTGNAKLMQSRCHSFMQVAVLLFHMYTYNIVHVNN